MFFCRQLLIKQLHLSVSMCLFFCSKWNPTSVMICVSFRIIGILNCDFFYREINFTKINQFYIENFFTWNHFFFFFCREEFPLGTWQVYYHRTRHPRVRVEPVPGLSPARWPTLYPITRVLMEPNIRHIIHICCLHKVQKVHPQPLTNGTHQIWSRPRAQLRPRAEEGPQRPPVCITKWILTLWRECTIPIR